MRAISPVFFLLSLRRVFSTPALFNLKKRRRSRMTPTSNRILIEPTTGNILIPPALLSDLPLLKRTVIADPALLNQIISLNSTLASAILEEGQDTQLETLVQRGAEENESICRNSQAPQDDSNHKLEEQRRQLNCCNDMMARIPLVAPELQEGGMRLPYVECYINGVPTLASLDCGCTHSLLTPAAAALHGLTPFIDPRITGRLPGIGGTGTFQGKVHIVELQFIDNNVNETVSLPGSFFVVDNSLHSCIIGMDFLSRFGCTVDFRAGFLVGSFRGGGFRIGVESVGEGERGERLERSRSRERIDTKLVRLC